MNEQSSRKIGKTPSKFLKDRKVTKKGKNVPEGRMTKKTGNKKDIA